MNRLEQLIRYNLHAPLEKKAGVLCMKDRGATPVLGNLTEELRSCAIGGQPGYGKSTAAAHWACTIALAGGDLVIIDPHCNAPKDSLAHAVEPLRDCFALPPIDFDDEQQVIAAFQWIFAEYEARKRKNGCHGKQLLFIIVDEWAELLDLFDSKDENREMVLKAVRSVAKGGRKLGMFIVLLNQQWLLESTGGSQVRKSLGGRVSFASELADMRLTLATDDTKALSMMCHPPLRRGEAIMKRNGIGYQRVSFMKTGRHECQIVADAIAEFAPRTPQKHSPIAERSLLYGEGIHAASQAHSPHSPLDAKTPLCTFSHASEQKPIGLRGLERVESENVFTRKMVNGRVEPRERNAIIAEGNKQLRETGKVVRTKIRDSLQWNNKSFPKIKAVCDEMGWSTSMEGMTKEQWEAMKADCDYQCPSCGLSEPDIELEADHIVPRSRGGADSVSNRQPLCKACNQRKATKTIEYR